jgi:hypothetical protein
MLTYRLALLLLLAAASALSLGRPAAERLLLGDADRRGGRRDRRQARRMALSLGPFPGLADNARVLAEQLVKENRRGVAALAAALLVLGRLSGRQVRRLLDGPPPRTHWSPAKAPSPRVLPVLAALALVTLVAAWRWG